jgi:histidine triad (HIT) family protein
VNCPFCYINDHPEVAIMLHADAELMAFMDINPIRPGHVLIVSRAHEPEFFNLPESVLINIMALARRIAAIQKELFKPLRVGALVAGGDVPHAHFHLVPMLDNEDVTSKRSLDGLAVRVPAEELVLRAEAIRARLAV